MANSSSSDASNPLGGILGGGSSSGRTDMTWNNLTGHEKKVAWGTINDVFMQILGRSATMSEAQKYYNSGISNYALGQQLMMSKEFVHTKIFHQLKRGYMYELQQFVGAGFKLSNKLAQSFAAHNYTTTDLQAWIYSHPHVYMKSNDFKTRVAQMADIYKEVFGVDPYAQLGVGDQNQSATGAPSTNKGRQPGQPGGSGPGGGGKNPGVIVGGVVNGPGNIRRGRPQVGVPGSVPGSGAGGVINGPGHIHQPGMQQDQPQTDTSTDPLYAHIRQAALHFQTPDQYRAWLMRQPAYRHHVLTQIQPGGTADAGLTLDSRGRPVQKALGAGAAADTAQ